MGTEDDLTAQSTALSPAAAGKSREVEQEALDAVIAATQAYLPPDGISAQECINRILGAVDNPRIVAALRSRLQPAAASEAPCAEAVNNTIAESGDNKGG